MMPRLDKTLNLPRKLAILGYGPKGIAIAAKRQTLLEVGLPVPELIILEETDTACNWLGGSKGFTDGDQFLGTPPEKDVGFPYPNSSWGKKSREINEKMMRFSWQRYKVEVSQYSRWIDRNRPS